LGGGGCCWGIGGGRRFGIHAKRHVTHLSRVGSFVDVKFKRFLMQDLKKGPQRDRLRITDHMGGGRVSVGGAESNPRQRFL